MPGKYFFMPVRGLLSEHMDVGTVGGGGKREEKKWAKQVHVGDIVEAQLSIIAVCTRTGQKRLKLNLRSIALIDESFSKVHHQM